MANTYTQCYFHLVFAVKNRDALIKREWKDEMEKYITGISQNHRHKVLAIGSMSEEHHRQRSFREEYLDMLINNEIAYQDEYLFDFILDV